MAGDRPDGWPWESAIFSPTFQVKCTMGQVFWAKVRLQAPTSQLSRATVVMTDCFQVEGRLPFDSMLLVMPGANTTSKRQDRKVGRLVEAAYDGEAKARDGSFRHVVKLTFYAEERGNVTTSLTLECPGRDAPPDAADRSTAKAQWGANAETVCTLLQRGIAEADESKRSKPTSGSAAHPSSITHASSTSAGTKRSRDLVEAAVGGSVLSPYDVSGARAIGSGYATGTAAAALRNSPGSSWDWKDEPRAQQSSGGLWRLPAPAPASASATMQGFSNIGNTCYMNAVLTALLHLPAVSRVLLDPQLRFAVEWQNHSVDQRMDALTAALRCDAATSVRTPARASHFHRTRRRAPTADDLVGGDVLQLPYVDPQLELSDALRSGARPGVAAPLEVIDMTDDAPPTTAERVTLDASDALFSKPEAVMRLTLSRELFERARETLGITAASLAPDASRAFATTIAACPPALRAQLAAACASSPLLFLRPPRREPRLFTSLRALLFRKLDGATVEESGLRTFKSALSAYNRDFGGYQQQDAHEFLENVVDALATEADAAAPLLSKLCERLPLPAERVASAVTPAERLAEQDWLSFASSFSARTMWMQVRATFTCKACGKRHSVTESFRDLSVAFPSLHEVAKPEQARDAKSPTAGSPRTPSPTLRDSSSLRKLRRMDESAHMSSDARDAQVAITIDEDPEDEPVGENSRTPQQSTLTSFLKPLPAPASKPVPSTHELSDLLAHFFAETDLELKCEKCGNGHARATQELVSLPRVLVLHVKRFEIDPTDYRVSKRHDRVSFPAKLDLASVCAPEVTLPPPVDLRPPAAVDAFLDRFRDELVEKLRMRRQSSVGSAAFGSSLPSLTSVFGQELPQRGSTSVPPKTPPHHREVPKASAAEEPAFIAVKPRPKSGPVAFAEVIAQPQTAPSSPPLARAIAQPTFSRRLAHDGFSGDDENDDESYAPSLHVNKVGQQAGRTLALAPLGDARARMREAMEMSANRHAQSGAGLAGWGQTPSSGGVPRPHAMYGRSSINRGGVTGNLGLNAYQYAGSANSDVRRLWERKLGPAGGGLHGGMPSPSRPLRNDGKAEAKPKCALQGLWASVETGTATGPQTRPLARSAPSSQRTTSIFTPDGMTEEEALAKALDLSKQEAQRARAHVDDDAAWKSVDSLRACSPAYHISEEDAPADPAAGAAATVSRSRLTTPPPATDGGVPDEYDVEAGEMLFSSQPDASSSITTLASPLRGASRHSPLSTASTRPVEGTASSPMMEVAAVSGEPTPHGARAAGTHAIADDDDIRVISHDDLYEDDAIERALMTSVDVGDAEAAQRLAAAAREVPVGRRVRLAGKGPCLPAKYSLHAIVRHQGQSATSGHYTSYVKGRFTTRMSRTKAFTDAALRATTTATPDPVEAAAQDPASFSPEPAESQGWYCFDDSHVSKLPNDEVFSAMTQRTGYMFFYVLDE